MDTVLAKRISFKVARKLKIVRAFVPQRRISDDKFLQEIGADRVVETLSRFPNILPGLAEQANLKIIERQFATDFERSVTVARNALRHRFDLLGSGLVDLGTNINWNLDFKSGKIWEKRDFRLQRLVDLKDDSDVKVPWELSRCNHFLPMAVACLVTDNESYRVEFENQVLSWIEQNEYLQTVNWACPMETAIRCINWLVAFKAFCVKNEFSEEFCRTLLIELFKGGISIFENLEKTGDGHNTNHYLSDLLGLLYLGELFGHTAKGAAWRKFAITELESELPRQVDSNGLDYESSLPYHGLVTEMFLLAVQLSETSDFKFTAQYHVKLALMLQNLARFTYADGLVESFGDNDDGRVLKPFMRHPRDFRDVIDVGANLLSGLEWISKDTAPERLCHIAGAVKKEARIGSAPSWSSIRLTDSGICQMRSENLILNFFANPIGTAGLGNHKHNDFLSFTLHYRGIPMFVDPGSYIYTADENLRNLFRSTLSHNTVTVDNFEQNRMVNGLMFLLRVDGTPRILDWQSNDQFDLVVAEHDGYGRLDEPVIHRRSIYLDKSSETVLLRDELTGVGTHRLEFTFNVDNARIATGGLSTILLKPLSEKPSLAFEICNSPVGLTVDTNWISPSYGVKHPGIRLFHNVHTPMPYKQLFAIAPWNGADSDSFDKKVTEIRNILQW